MSHRPLITMTTDFGYDDPFVGVMKGVIYTINPDVNIVDLTHSITPQDIGRAALTIGMNYRYFPEKSIHLALVDPGVGSSRRPLLVISDKHCFIGPDNGVFSYIYLIAAKDLQVIHITADHLFLMKDSPTFQGRDLFAPCAAWLSKDVKPAKFGEAISDYKTIHLPVPERLNDQCLKGEVIFIDRFGNAITNIRKEDVTGLHALLPEGSFKVVFREREIELSGCYAAAEGRGIAALINSSGLLELFVFGGDAALENNIAPGDVVNVLFS